MKRLLPMLFLLPSLVLGATEPESAGLIERLAPELDALIAPNARLKKCAEGFTWAEGPVWFHDALVFSDVPENRILRWAPGGAEARIWLQPSGMLTPKPGFREPGSNGLAVDTRGRLIICQQGERRLARLEEDRSQTVLAASFEGKRFNSPNDLALRKNGDIYFTDPPYGLDKGNDSPLKELAFNGVFRVSPKRAVSLIISDLTSPNGIGFSPDEKLLYVSVSDGKWPRIMAYEVQPDGSAANGRVFFDASTLKGPGRKGSCDGLKVDIAGNLFCTGPGGVLVISPQAKLLGILNTGQATANCAWGEDGSTLYICADMLLYRLKTKTRGAGWPTPPAKASR